MQITLILEAERFPDGETVRRPTGQKKYTLRREVKIYGDEGAKVNVSPDMMFLFDAESGTINCIDKKTKVAIDLDREDAIGFLISLRTPK